MPKTIIFSKRNKRNKRVSKKHYKKMSKNNKKYKKYRKTHKNKILKGGFSSAQFAGALAVAAVMDMDKIVLIPKEGTSSKRYDFEIDANNRPKISSGRMVVPGTRGNINIKNFNIFVGSTKSDLLIQIDGNDSVINRLAAITQTLAQPQNALVLIENAQEGGLITQPKADNLKEEVRSNAGNNMLTNSNVEPESKFFENFIKMILDLLGLFILYILKLISEYMKTPSSELTVTPQETSIAVVTPEETSNEVVVIVNNNPVDAGEAGEAVPEAAEAAEDINQLFNEIGNLPQFRDIGVDNPIEAPRDNTFKCVNPYNRTTATIKDRIKSCNRIGEPNPNFVGKTWPVLQTCVNECYSP